MRALLFAFAAAVLLASSCSRGSTYELAAESSLMPELERLAASAPPPPGWTRARPGAPADAVIELSARRDAAPSSFAGYRYLAAAVAIDDSRYSVGPDAARSIGLRPLEDISPPERALSVDGKWPGEKGYAFVEPLHLSARRAGSRNASFARGSPVAAWIETAAAASAASRGGPLRLAAAGDFQARGRESRLAAKGGIGTLLRGGILDSIRSADLAVVNFEGVASARGEPNPLKRFRFRMPPGSGAALASAGFDAALLANNHALDFGELAFLDTLGELGGAGLAVLGAGRDSDEASALADLPRGSGIRLIGFATYPVESLGFATADAAAGPSKPGINADEARTLESIRAAASSGGTVVVLAHGGAEYVAGPSAEVRARYARFADAGAALVLGGHPHVLQGIAARGRSLIAYSLGNFLFTGLEEPELSVKSAVLEFLLYEGKARGFRIRPVVVGMEYTEPDADLAGAEARFSRLCASLIVE
jgi:poly-gamma-glutamate synthesis protein (capsule biosynthesis protein)